MPNLAQVNLIGHLGRDPEPKTSKKGSTYATASIAVTIKSAGEKETTWYNLSIFGQSAKFAVDYLKKGEAVFVTGELKPREYVSKDGIHKTSMDVAVSKLVPVGKREQSNDADREQVKQVEGYEDDVPF